MGLMVKAAFSVWQEYLAQQTQSHQLDDLKRSMKAKGEEHTKRMLGMLMNAQGEAMLKALVASWVELVVDARTAREVEKLALEMKARWQETSKRMLTMLMSSQRSSDESFIHVLEGLNG